jgi:hypothetical protein
MRGLSTAPAKNTVLAAASLIMNIKRWSATKLGAGYGAQVFLFVAAALTDCNSSFDPFLINFNT